MTSDCRITSKVAGVTVQVRLDSNLVERILTVGLIEETINRIYYLLLSVLTDSYVASSSDYWLEFAMSSVDVVLPTSVDVGGVSVPNNDYSIVPASDIVKHWTEITEDIQVTELIVLLLTRSSLVKLLHDTVLLRN